MDQIVWWTGAAVLAAGGFMAAAAMVAAASVAAVAIGTRHMRRIYNVGVNLRAVREWHLAGRPLRKLGSDAEWHWCRTAENVE